MESGNVDRIGRVVHVESRWTMLIVVECRYINQQRNADHIHVGMRFGGFSPKIHWFLELSRISLCDSDEVVWTLWS